MAAPEQQSVYVLRHAHRLDFALGREWHSDIAPPPLTEPRKKDPPLSPLGLAQATEVGTYFASLKGSNNIGAVLASPYLRCMQTAHPIAVALRLPLCVDDGLAELQPSFLDGAATPGDDTLVREVSLEERKHYFPLVDVTYRSAVAEGVLNSNQPFDIQQRYWQCVDLWLARNPGQSVVAVTHGWGVPAIAAGLTGVSLAEIAPHFPSTMHAPPDGPPDTNAALCSITRLVATAGQAAAAAAAAAWSLDPELVNSQAHLKTFNDEQADTKVLGWHQMTDLTARYYGKADPARPNRLLPLERTPWSLVGGSGDAGL